MLTELDRSQLNDLNNDFPFHNKATATDDCNVAMFSEAIELATGRQLTAVEVRALFDAPTGPTGNVNVERAFRALGLIYPDQYQMLWKGNPVQTVRDLLVARWFVVAYVDYGYLTQHGGTSGDPGYTGIHAVGVFDWFRQSGARHVHEADPLFDGRHAATPKGVQSVAFVPIRDAAASYAGPGMFSGYAVKPK